MSTAPRVAICVPTLNASAFLEARLSSILGQSFQNWEAVVVDGMSTDGTSETLRALAATDRRFIIHEEEPRGPYPAWNQCIQRSTAEFVYIATSDDTMAPDCLASLVDALDRHPECDIAHCPLRVINERDEEIPGMWLQATVFGDCGADPTLPHCRIHPLDGLLHLTGRHVYLSITQLLIRRSLFSKIGLFSDRWGNISDFNWEMRAGLVANTIHVPQTWASWRVHPGQLTKTRDFESQSRDKRIAEMIADAFEACSVYLPLEVLRSPLISETHDLRQYYSYINHGKAVPFRRLHQAYRLLVGPRHVRTEVIRQLKGLPKWPVGTPLLIANWLRHAGREPIVAV